MKVVQINSVPNGSTGSIMMNIHRRLREKEYESYVIWGRGRKPNDEFEICMNNKFDTYLHALYSRITGKTGLCSKRKTKNLIKKLKKISPDIVHMHNIHGYYINIELLFNYLKENNIKVVWTFHDCWPFTGHCAYFDLAKCDKWKNECKNCPQYKNYPKSLIDNSKWFYKKKKQLFTGVKDLTIVTPSKWLAGLVNKSFLKSYKTIVINNGINTNIFKKLDPKELKFRKEYNLDNKKIILGVASPWSERKGLKDFIELSKILNDDYKIVLVGLSKEQINEIPKNILGLERTNNIDELVDIYNSSDIFLNPTYEDNYPTTNLEAVACGLRVITYNTGGSAESAFLDAHSNDIIKKTSNPKENALKVYKTIINKKNISKESSFSIDYKDSVDKYIELYLNNKNLNI